MWGGSGGGFAAISYVLLKGIGSIILRNPPCTSCKSSNARLLFGFLFRISTAGRKVYLYILKELNISKPRKTSFLSS